MIKKPIPKPIKKKKKETNQTVLGIILLVVILVCVTGLGLIYWFEYRPADIRAMCEEEKKVNMRSRPPWKETKTRIRSYEKCLEENGINQ